MQNESEDNIKGKFGEPGFSVPEGYFNQLNRDIQTRIAEEKLKSLSISDGFMVPEFYFEQLTSKIKAKVVQEQPLKSTKVIRIWHSDLFKYAAAACFILMTAFGLYFNNQQTSQQTFSADLANEQMLFDIDEQVIINQLQEEQTSKASHIPSEQELEDYILSNYSQNDIATNL